MPTISEKVKAELLKLKKSAHIRVPHQALRLAEMHGKILSRRHKSTHMAAIDCISLAQNGYTAENLEITQE